MVKQLQYKLLERLIKVQCGNNSMHQKEKHKRTKKIFKQLFYFQYDHATYHMF